MALRAKAYILFRHGDIKESVRFLKRAQELSKRYGWHIRPDSAIGIKPISKSGSRRLIRAALDFAVAHDRGSVTLVHKGNIQKFTEGAFSQWGYEVAKERFGNHTITEAELWDTYDGQRPEDKVVIKDRIADMLFQQVLLRPDEFAVIATPNLNGDYISDALAAQVGGLGMAPGANILPIKVLGMDVVMNRKALDLTEMKPVRAELRFRDLGVGER